MWEWHSGCERRAALYRVLALTALLVSPAGVMCATCERSFGTNLNGECSKCGGLWVAILTAVVGFVVTLAMVAVLVFSSLSPGTFRANATRASNNIKVRVRECRLRVGRLH